MLRNVETMNYADIEKGLNALGEKVRNMTDIHFSYRDNKERNVDPIKRFCKEKKKSALS